MYHEVFNKVSPVVAYAPLEYDACTQPRRNPSFCALADLMRDWRVDQPKDDTNNQRIIEPGLSPSPQAHSESHYMIRLAERSLHHVRSRSVGQEAQPCHVLSRRAKIYDAPVAVQRESLRATQCSPAFLSLASLGTTQPMKSMSTPYLPGGNITIRHVRRRYLMCEGECQGLGGKLFGSASQWIRFLPFTPEDHTTIYPCRSPTDSLKNCALPTYTKVVSGLVEPW